MRRITKARSSYFRYTFPEIGMSQELYAISHVHQMTVYDGANTINTKIFEYAKLDFWKI
jgi:hypothetical protein